MALDVTWKNPRRSRFERPSLTPDELRKLAAHFGSYALWAINYGDPDAARVWARSAAQLAREALEAEASPV